MSDFTPNVSYLINKALELNCHDEVLQFKTIVVQDSNLHRRMLVGKLMSQIFFSLVTIKSTLTKSWNINRRFQIKSKKSDLFIFTFEHEVDVQLVMQNRLWCIHNQLLSLQEWPPDISFEELEL